jgi:hypothetical protein
MLEELKRLSAEDDFVVLDLDHGKQCLVSRDDWESKLKQFSWRASENKKKYSSNWYVRGWGSVSGEKPRSISMHRLILNAPTTRYVDHINGNGLDNRRSNLRLASAQENTRSSPKPRLNATSQYKGVTVKKNKNYISWHACIGVGNNTSKSIGTYKCEHTAALIYDLVAAKLFGDFAKTNFPREILKYMRLPDTKEFQTVKRVVKELISEDI